MFEKRNQPVLPIKAFFVRFTLSLLLALFVIFIALFLGMLGYHFFEHMSWVDSFANASMILSGMGPLTPLQTTAGKIFAGCYALFSGLAFILIIGIILAPIVHRFFHSLHIDTDDNDDESK